MTMTRSVLALAFTISAAFTARLNAQRRYVDLDMSQPRLWTRTSDDQDTTLVAPNRIIVAHGLLIVTDPRAPAVVALDLRTGTTIWRYAPHSGSGPGEMKQPDIAADNPRGVLVSDNGTHRLYLLSAASGKLLQEHNTPNGRFITGLCSLHDGRLVLETATMSGTPFLLATLGSNDITPLRFPFDTGGHAQMLDFAADLAPVTLPSGATACTASRKTADGLAIIPTTATSKAVPFIEHGKQREVKPVEQIRDTSDLPIAFSLRSGQLGSFGYVWFGGSECGRHCIDFYATPSLSYVVTARMVKRMGIGLQDLVINGDMLYVLGAINGAPTITAIHFPASSIH